MTSRRQANPSSSPATRAAPLLVEVADRHPRALGRQPPRGGRADPRGAAGDERDLSLEPHAGSVAVRAGRRGRALVYSAAVRLLPFASSAPPARSASAWPCGFGRAGVPIVIGSREAERAARNGRARAARSCPRARSPVTTTRTRCAQAEQVILSVPLSQPVRDARQPQGRAARRPAADRRDRAARGGRRAARRRACSACGRARPRSRRGRWCREGVRVVSALHTVSAASLTDLDHQLGAGRAGVRRRARGQARGGRADRADRGPALRGLRAPGDVAHHRVADRAADRASTPATRSHAGIRLTGLPEKLWE